MRTLCIKGITVRVLTILSILLFPSYLFAHISFVYIDVQEFKNIGNAQQTLTYEIHDNSKQVVINQDCVNSKYILHIRFNKNCITELIQSKDINIELQKYLEATEELKKQIANSCIILFGLKSGVGFHAIPGKPNEFQADNMGILETEESKIVYSIHSDLGTGYCDRE